jgi:DNA polymerase III subunit epsilon
MGSSIAFIDFETANRAANSACQLGVVLVDSWNITEEKEWLIRPQRLYFSPLCINVHGITPRDVMTSPQWDSVWTELEPMLRDRVIIAHNAGFDASVLLACCQSHEIAFAPMDLNCTRLIAKRAWAGLPSYALASLAEKLAIRFRHHNALEDARASAIIAMEAAKKLQAADLESLEDMLGILRGRITLEQVRQPRCVRRNRIETVAEPQPRYQPKLFRGDGIPSATKTEQSRRTRMRADAILAGSGDTKPLAGKHVVLVHTLLGLAREDAVSFLSQLGATVQASINLQTNYVIVGTESEHQDKPSDAGDAKSQPRFVDNVAERNALGQPIRILSQRQLLAVIPSALAIARGE